MSVIGQECDNDSSVQRDMWSKHGVTVPVSLGAACPVPGSAPLSPPQTEQLSP